MKNTITSLTVALFVVVLSLVSSGCSNLNGTRVEPLLGGDVNLVKLGDKVAEMLANQSFPPLFPRKQDQPVLVTTLVDNTDLTNTSHFGRTLQNHIAAGFVKRGFAVKEMKLTGDVLIQAQRGEFMLSRHLDNIAGKQRAQATVVGTYSMSGRVMYLSIRLVSPGDRNIRATYDDKLYLDENTLRLLGLQYAAAGNSGEDFVKPPSTSILDTLLYW